MKFYDGKTIPYIQEFFLNKKTTMQSLFIWIISAFIAFVFIFMSYFPFEEVIKATGYIRPDENISTVSNAITGRIKTISYKSGQIVKKGELLLEIDPTQLEAEKESLISQMDEDEQKLNSLYEINESILQSKNLVNKKYQEAFLRYEVWIINLEKLENIKKLKQEKYLQEKNLPESMTTTSRLQELESEYLIACNDYDNLFYSFKHDINAEIITLETSKKKNNARLNQIYDSISFTKVCAPIDGVIQEISVFNINDWVQAGQQLLNIIPDVSTETQVELSIPAKQAGKIEEGMNVKMRFPSLPYHEFGGTEGKIITIDPDITKTQSTEAIFIMKTNLDNEVLCDKKGKEYPLKVGLQVDARIILSRKTIMQFLLEKLNLWY